jgi:hypothetical protein
MLYSLSTSSRKRISGRSLAYLLRGAPPSEKAKIALGLISGEITITNLTAKQAIALTGASRPHMKALQPDEVASLSLAETEQALDKLLERTARMSERLKELLRARSPQPESCGPAEEPCEPTPESCEPAEEPCEPEPIATAKDPLAAEVERRMAKIKVKQLDLNL